MAVGDVSDIQTRLQRLSPNGWFSKDLVPIRDALLAGFASMFAFVYSALDYIRQQTRIATATDGFLDLVAYDYFGNNLLRAAGQTDDSFRVAIIAFLFRERCTRRAVTLVIQQLLGTTPKIVEYQSVNDCGAYDNATNLAYNTAGCYGSRKMPLGAFVTVSAHADAGAAPPLVAGYGIPVGAWATPSRFQYISKGGLAISRLTAADIYRALDSVRPVTGQLFVKIAIIP